MKKNILLLGFIIENLTCLSQTEDGIRIYDIIGLPNGDTILDNLKIAIPLVIIGGFIAYLFLWRPKDKSEISGVGSKIGCSGLIIVGIGFIYLLPLWAWIEYIFGIILGILFLFVIAHAIYEEWIK